MIYQPPLSMMAPYPDPWVAIALDCNGATALVTCSIHPRPGIALEVWRYEKSIIPATSEVLKPCARSPVLARTGVIPPAAEALVPPGHDVQQDGFQRPSLIG
jgi:hypothetical protein